MLRGMSLRAKIATAICLSGDHDVRVHASVFRSRCEIEQPCATCLWNTCGTPVESDPTCLNHLWNSCGERSYLFELLWRAMLLVGILQMEPPPGARSHGEVRTHHLCQTPYRCEFPAQGEQMEPPPGRGLTGRCVQTPSGRPPTGVNSLRRASRFQPPRGEVSRGGAYTPPLPDPLQV